MPIGAPIGSAALNCTKCEFANPPAMRFCGNCGAPLAAGQHQADRRQVTVMFCDLVDSTYISGLLDPEDLRELLHDYQTTANAVIDHYGGHVAQYLGDGLLVYFGYPKAHEDDARRAVSAGLDILGRMEALNERLAHHGIRIAARIGIETGAVVTGDVGEGATRERLALGQTPNIAARLEAEAAPGCLVLGERTFALVREHFDLEYLGARTLKGVTEPIDAYRALAPRDKASNDATGHSKFVGRAAELDRLMSLYSHTVAGAGSSVSLVGEPGIGKSRLLAALKYSTGEERLWLSAACSPFAQNTPLHPFVQLLRHMFNLLPHDSSKEQVDKLTAGLAGFGGDIAAVLQYFAQLLNLTLDGIAPLDISSDLWRARLIDALAAYFLRLSATRPVVLALEDLHWADPTTLAVLSKLSAHTADSALLLLTSSRPRVARDRAHHIIELDRIADAEIEAMTRDMVGDRALDPSVLALLIERTDGIPLFVEELVKEMLESGVLVHRNGVMVFADDTSERKIPATLQSSLVARIDRLGDAKRVAQVGSVFGREFRRDALAIAVDLDASILDDALAKLVDSGLVTRQDNAGTTLFSFKHAMVQEAAYSLLLRKDRRDHHSRIANILQREFPAEGAVHPELIAHHYTQAGLAPQAIAFWVAAGQLALGSSASEEASAHVNHGLELLREMPDSMEKTGLEVQLRITQGTAVRTAKGFAALDVIAPYERAAELAKVLGSVEAQVMAMMGIRLYHMVRGELAEALAIDHELLHIALASEQVTLIAIARMNLATCLIYLGRFSEALALFEQALAIDSDAVDSLRILLGFDLHVQSHASAAMCLWHLGKANDARAQSKLAIDRIARVSHGFSSASGYVFAGAELHHFFRDVTAVDHYAERIIAVSSAHGYPSWLSQGIMFRGWAHAAAEAEDAKAAVEACLAQINSLRGAHELLGQSYFRGLAAEALLMIDDVQAASDALDDALALVDQTGDEMWEAELHRLAGDVSMKRGDPRGAEAHYRTAIATANRQGSRALELRASVSMAHLCRKAGRNDEATALVSAIVHVLGDGHETTDMNDARQLLASS